MTGYLSPLTQTQPDGACEPRAHLRGSAGRPPEPHRAPWSQLATQITDRRVRDATDAGHLELSQGARQSAGDNQPIAP